MTRSLHNPEMRRNDYSAPGSEGTTKNTLKVNIVTINPTHEIHIIKTVQRKNGTFRSPYGQYFGKHVKKITIHGYVTGTDFLDKFDALEEMADEWNLKGTSTIYLYGESYIVYIENCNFNHQWQSEAQNKITYTLSLVVCRSRA